MRVAWLGEGGRVKAKEGREKAGGGDSASGRGAWLGGWQGWQNPGVGGAQSIVVSHTVQLVEVPEGPMSISNGRTTQVVTSPPTQWASTSQSQVFPAWSQPNVKL